MRVNAGEVSDGMRLLKTVVNDVANSVGSDPESAADAQGRIEPIWSSIEGSVKATEPETYRLLEDQFGIIQKALSPADPVKERAAADAVVKAADGYLSRHGGASTSAPAGGPDAVGEESLPSPAPSHRAG